MSQTSYAINQGVPYAGLLGEEGYPNSIRTALNEVTAGLPFGIAVKKGTADDGVINLSAGTDKVWGITVHRHSVNTIGSAAWGATVGSPLNDRLDILCAGTVWVKVEEAVTPASPVFVRFASGAGGTILGSFRASADTTTALALKGARYLTSASGGGYAMVEFNALVQF